MNSLGCMKNELMGILTVADIIAATGGEIISNASHSFTGVSIDSRTIKDGELFIALKGSKFDGHNFLQVALERGSGAVVSCYPGKPVYDRTIISVKNTLEALQGIARYMRLKRDIPVIAVTGSNGKTTTKELIASIVGAKYRVLKNSGNLNNHIGLPLSLTRISNEDEVAVLEMGASAPGEIEELCKIAIPHYGVLTNISEAHLEGFKDLETVRKTKLEMLDYISVAVVNADDPFLMEGIRLSGFKGWLVRYGIKNHAEIRATDIRLCENGSIFRLCAGENKSIEVNPKISGMFNIYNLLAAASVGYILNIELIDIKNAVDSFTGLPMRLEFKERKGIRVISDVYNANPASTEEAIRELVRIRKGRAIAVLGDMLELGSFAEGAHRRLGRSMSGLPIDIFIAVGPLMAFAAAEFEATVYKVKSAVEAGRLLWDICKAGDTVLIKGSRGMNMERVLGE